MKESKKTPITPSTPITPISPITPITLITLITLMALPLLASCEYKELCYDHNHWSSYNAFLQLELKLDLEVDIEVDEESHTQITTPEYMKVCFYDPESRGLKNTEFVGPTGGRLYTAPGDYDMVVYTFGTEYIQIRGEGDINTLEAFTSDITATKGGLLRGFTRSGEYEAPGPIIYTPDHLLVAHRPVTIPDAVYEDAVVTIPASASTVIETYGFEVTNVTGAQYVSSVEAFVTNQARSTFFGRGEVNPEPATVYFPVGVDKENGKLRTSFNTFGKLPGESECYLHIVIIDSDGDEIRISKDITDQFDKEDHEIVIDDGVDVPAPTTTGGGIAPSVDPWEEEQHDVNIG